MEFGIFLSPLQRFREERMLLDGLADYYEIFPSGEEDAELLQGEDCKFLVHLPELDGPCFETLELVRFLKVEKVVVHFKTKKEMKDDEKISLLKRLLKRAEEYRVKVCLENTIEDVETIRRVLEAIPGLMFCLDIGHANLFSNNPIDFLKALSDRLEHIHLHDNFGGNSEKDDLHLPPGYGNINFKDLFLGLKSIEYDKTLTLEVSPRFPIDIRIESLRLIRTLLKEN